MYTNKKSDQSKEKIIITKKKNKKNLDCFFKTTHNAKAKAQRCTKTSL